MRISDWSSDVCSSDLRGLGWWRATARRTSSTTPLRLTRKARKSHRPSSEEEGLHHIILIPRFFARRLFRGGLRLFLRLLLLEDPDQLFLALVGKLFFGRREHLLLFLVDMVEIAILHRPEPRQPAGRGKIGRAHV